MDPPLPWAPQACLIYVGPAGSYSRSLSLLNCDRIDGSYWGPRMLTLNFNH